MDIYTFLIVNGPNLGHLGQRQPEIYGEQDLNQLKPLVQDILGAKAKEVELLFFQSNSEGGIIDRLEQARTEDLRGVVLNAGAYTHTSLAIADCLAWIGIPCVEVHLSNVWSREEEIRHQSLMARHCLGVVAGFGLLSYALALQALLLHVQRKDQPWPGLG